MKLLILFLSVLVEYYLLQYVNSNPMMAVAVISVFFGCQLYFLLPKQVKPYSVPYYSILY